MKRYIRRRERPPRSTTIAAIASVAGASLLLSSTSITQAFQSPSALSTPALALHHRNRNRIQQIQMSKLPIEQTKDDAATSSSSSSATDDVPGNGGLQNIDVLNERITNGSSFQPQSSSSTSSGDNLHKRNGHDDGSNNNLPPLLQKLSDKIGQIDESRIASTPEYLSGEVPTLFTNIHYETIERRNEHGNATETITIVRAKQSNEEADETSMNLDYLPSSALLCGTAIGCGLLTLPTAISSAGYLPTIIATIVAYVYMTISALLTSELLLNRYGETGKVRNVGLLELYTSYLGGVGGKLAGFGFLVVSYIVMGVYLSEGGDTLMRLLDVTTATMNPTLDGAVVESGSTAMSVLSSSMQSLLGNDNAFSELFSNHMSLASRAIFIAFMGIFLSAAAKYNNVQRTMIQVFVPTTLVTFVGATCIGLPTADFASLFAIENQHPELVLNAFPLLFMSWTYHGVVPRVVYDLEGDKDKITKAIVVGSTTALVIYLTWNAMILGNVLSATAASPTDTTAATTAMNLIGTIEESSAVVLGDLIGMDGGGESATTAMAAVTSSDMSSTVLDTVHSNPLLQSSVAMVSELAIITSLIGVVLGFVNEFNDAIGTIPSSSFGPKEDNKWKVAMLTLLPPAIISVVLGYYRDSFDINNYQIIDYTGIFGSSILFLILPALMAWENRYGDEDPPRPLTVRPMVPLGKIPLGSLYKAAGTLLVEQGLEKLGVFEFVKELWNNNIPA